MANETKIETPAVQPVATPAPAPATPEVKPDTNAPAPVNQEVKPAVAEPPKDGDDTTILGGKPPEEGKPADGKPKEVKQEAPEKYADFVLPEGITLDKALAEKAVAEFKGMNLSQEQAQKLVTLQAEHAKAHAADVLNAFKQTISEWKDQSLKLYGNDAQKQLGVAAAAIDRFGSPELRQLFNDTGLGNHPEVVKFCVAVGKMMAEDQPGEGRKPQGERSTAELMFPSMAKK